MAIPEITDHEWLALSYDWEGMFARPSQIVPPGDWLTWLIMSGRGFGKSRVGAEFIRAGATHGMERMALVGATAADVRDTMVEGESGLLACCPPWDKPTYLTSRRQISWNKKSQPTYGARAYCFSGDKPDLLRGPQHFRAWVDELAAMRRARLTWDNLMFGLRLGPNPQVVVTTTPRPIRLLRELVSESTTVTTGGSTYENLDNLSPVFRERVIARYEGTTIGEQELKGKLLDEAPGALWKRKNIEKYRKRKRDVPDLVRIAVAIDPSVEATGSGDECGIVTGGITADGRVWILDDISGSMSPNAWAGAAVNAYHELGADRIVAETNQGGALVELTIRTVDPSVSYTSVWAARGKYVRAEPIAALYEQGKVHHAGVFAELEDEQCNWSPGEKSPNRLDALVWLVTYLTGKKRASLAAPSGPTGASRFAG